MDCQKSSNSNHGIFRAEQAQNPCGKAWQIPPQEKTVLSEPGPHSGNIPAELQNISQLAEDAGITRKTAESWLSILETSYIIYLLKPYYKNFGKRVIKNPKLYFYDTGLVSSLLGITSSEQIENFYMRGALFENFIVSELIKKRIFAGKTDELFFWRDSNGVEIDVIEENGLELYAYEIKASETMNSAFFSNIKKAKNVIGLDFKNTAVIYGGTREIPSSNECGAYISWKKL